MGLDEPRWRLPCLPATSALQCHPRLLPTDACARACACPQECGEPSLRALRPLAARQPQLARSLLCAALLDVMQGDTINGAVSRAIAARIDTLFADALRVQPPPSIDHLDACKLLAHMLISLRARTMHARHATKRGVASVSSATQTWAHAFWDKVDLPRAVRGVGIEARPPSLHTNSTSHRRSASTASTPTQLLTRSRRTPSPLSALAPLVADPPMRTVTPLAGGGGAGVGGAHLGTDAARARG